MEAITNFSALEIVERKSIDYIDYTRMLSEQLYREHKRICVVASGSFRIMIRSFQVRRELMHLNKLIGSLEITTDHDRSWCKDRSEQLLNLSEKIEETKEASARIPYCLFSSSIQRCLDDAVCLAEDASETLSLAASLDFKNVLEQSLVAHGVS